MSVAGIDWQPRKAQQGRCACRLACGQTNGQVHKVKCKQSLSCQMHQPLTRLCFESSRVAGFSEALKPAFCVVHENTCKPELRQFWDAVWLADSSGVLASDSSQDADWAAGHSPTLESSFQFLGAFGAPPLNPLAQEVATFVCALDEDWIQSVLGV